MTKRPFSLAGFATLFALSLPTPTLAEVDCSNKPHIRDRFSVSGPFVKQLDQPLEWKRCAEGARWDSKKRRCYGEPLLISQDQAVLRFEENKNGWRLPTIQELFSLLYSTCANKKELRTLFPDLRLPIFRESAHFWSTTQDEDLTRMYYYLDFHSYALDFHSQGYSLAVRAVRDTN
ncbi:DUF1566 domain-containing protein [Pseudovibrio brasiliensis]|uniref:DUF1566 domain-containing protein n=1 Tax=Pseudovibrio brasiliensis TaxID=1898042 RepID=A0ABX8AVR9_9HYPH|nr:DUF1566 domain-containing protein [Pseudovibrio brasiliensis]QUS58800.1 DUF1566 domain-containing protein [Pseudovibrio brasiliensis]